MKSARWMMPLFLVAVIAFLQPAPAKEKPKRIFHLVPACFGQLFPKLLSYSVKNCFTILFPFFQLGRSRLSIETRWRAAVGNGRPLDSVFVIILNTQRNECALIAPDQLVLMLG